MSDALGAKSHLDSRLEICSQRTMEETNSQENQDGPHNVQTLVSSVEKWKARVMEIEQERKEVAIKKQEVLQRLQKLRQDQSLARTILDQRKSDVENAIKTREAAATQVQQNSQVTQAFLTHFESVKETLEKLTAAKNSSAEDQIRTLESSVMCRETLRVLKDEQLPAWQNLQKQVQEQAEFHTQLVQKWNEKLEDQNKKHHETMQRLNGDLSSMVSKKLDLEQKLATKKEMNEELQTKMMKMAQLHEERKERLTQQVNFLEAKTKDSKVALDNVLKEKAVLKDEIAGKSKHIQRIKDMLTTSETKKAEYDAQIEMSTKLLEGKKSKISEILEDLKELQSQNTDLKLKLQESRHRMEESKIKSAEQISELRKKQESIHLESLHRMEKLQEEISVATLKCDSLEKSRDDLRDEVAAAQSKLSNVMQFQEKADSVGSSLKTQWNLKQTERQNLICELEEVKERLRVEKDRVPQLEFSLQQKNESNDKRVGSICSEIQEIKEKILAGNRALQERQENVASLRNKIIVMKEESSEAERLKQNNLDLMVQEYEEALAHLTEQREIMIGQSNKATQDLKGKVDSESHQLDAIKNEILQGKETHETLTKKINAMKDEAANITKEIEEKEEKSKEVTVKIQNLEKLLQDRERQLKELQNTKDENVKKLQLMNEKLFELHREVQTTENTKAKAISENSKEMEVLFSDLRKAKHNLESVSRELTELYENLKMSKKDHADSEVKLQALQKSLSDLEAQHQGKVIQTEENEKELELLKANHQTLCDSIEKEKNDAVLAENIYQKLHKVLLAARNKKKKQQESVASHNSPRLRADGKENSVEGETDETDETPGKEDKLQSILKPPSTFTPQKEVKNVSFAKPTVDIDSSSSSIILESQDAEEINKNPEARHTIAARKAEERQRRI